MADFFDKMRAGINKGVTNISANSKALVDKTKVNTNISTLERERKQLYQTLGYKAHEIYISTCDITVEGEIASIISDIERCNESIAQQRKQLELIDEEVRNAIVNTATVPVAGNACTCGHTNPEGSKFCMGCGRAIAPPQSATAMAFCTNCGVKADPGALFCVSCGGSIADAASPAAATVNEHAKTGATDMPPPAFTGIASNVCSKCGKVYVPGEDVFCMGCGQKL